MSSTNTFLLKYNIEIIEICIYSAYWDPNIGNLDTFILEHHIILDTKLVNQKVVTLLLKQVIYFYSKIFM